MNDEATIGHNRGVEGEDMKRYFERIQRLEADKQEIADDIKDVKAEAKARGYDMKTFGKAYALWKLDEEQRALLGVYADALGIFE